MTSHSKSGILAGAFALAIGLGNAAPAQAQSTVVRTSGPSSADLPIGRKLADGQRVVLAAGDTITVIDSSGTRVLKGPGQFTIGARSEAKRAVLNTFITRNAGRQRARVGAVRGDAGQDGAVSAPTVWLLDEGDSGRFCHARDARLLVWRQSNAGPTVLSIAASESGDPVSLAWDDGSRISAWPQEQAPIEAGAQYRLGSAEKEGPVEIVFVLLQEEPADVETLAAVLAENGCTSQLERLIAAVGESAVEENPE